MTALQQALIKNLASASIGQGGSFDVFSPALDKAMGQAVQALTIAPVAIPADAPASDAPASDQPVSEGELS